MPCTMTPTFIFIYSLDRISEYHFRWLLRRMLDRLQECRQSLRSLFKLTQETDLICKKYPSLSLNSTALRVSLGSQCQTLFDSLRDTTLSLQHLMLSYRPRQLTADNDTSANDSDDADIANVCQLPREAFENLLTEKTPSIQQIKVSNNTFSTYYILHTYVHITTRTLHIYIRTS